MSVTECRAGSIGVARTEVANLAKLPVLLLSRTGQNVPERPTHRDNGSRDNNNDYDI
jgi:hypothetical protein